MSSDGAVLHACWQPNLPRTGESPVHRTPRQKCMTCQFVLLSCLNAASLN